MTAESRRASFFSLVGEQQDDGPAIEWVEIPLFQRDYAQGRETDRVRRIRADFLDALRLALVGDDPDPVGLDFVYGGIEQRTLQPLDGQQRLTTLFLLHWYVASRSGNLAEGANWTRFSYATRQSARMFCASLAEHSLPEGVVPSDWIVDQPWYLFVWRHDPTIQSMLVMLDAIDERFRDVDASTAWARLTNAENPAIWFLLLPLSGLSSDGAEDMRPEQLYIKMNSRGKPLTEFENFKAHFEKSIQWSPRSADFALKADTTWSDLLWHVRGQDDLIDDEFLRYIEFVTEVCEWRDGRAEGFGTPLGLRTSAVFGEQSARRHEHLDFLFDAFDVWRRVSIAGTFEDLFASPNDAEADTTKVRLFFRSEGGAQDPLNLFELCCRSYGETRGRTRVFTLGQSLVLHAVLLHLFEGTPDFPRRVRILRNLIEASINELRPDRMPKILEDVESLIRDGSLEKVTSLNQAQAEDEKLKAAFLVSHPHLRDAAFALEDHELLRGSLGAFELDASHFEARAGVFRSVMSQPELWPDFLAALLAVGEYQRQRTHTGPFLFGTESKRHEGAWRDLLTGPPRDALQKTREVLAEFLDKVAAAPTLPLDALRADTKEYLDGCITEGLFDWRYYMVKYPSMREKGSSTYFAEITDADGQAKMGYSLCMLKPGYGVRNSNYRDPYLLAIWRELGDTAALEDKWFTGYEYEPRRLPLKASGTTIRCVPAGFELTPPPLDADEARFAAVRTDIGADANNLVRVRQVEVDGCWIDTVDRVQLGADIVRRLVAAGL